MANDLMKADDTLNFMEMNSSYCSLIPADDVQAKILFEAMNSPTCRLEDCINMPICVKDVYAEMIDICNDKTGEVSNAIRIVLIDTEGKSYGCCSIGVYSSIRKLIRVFGEPSWENGINVTPVMVPSRTRSNAKVMTLKLV